MDVAQRMKQLPQQFFANLALRVQGEINAGHDIINLGQGNPDQPTPAHIVDTLREAARDPMTHKYPPFTGLPALKSAVAAFYAREYGVEVNPETEVAILFGGKAGLVEVSQIYLNPGDVALVPDPGYPDYWSGVALAGGRMVKLPLTADRAFLPDLSAISDTDWQAAKLMFLNYPHNPTGAIATPAFFEEVVRRAAAHEVYVVHDFAYGAIGFDNIKPPSFLQTQGAKSVGIEIYTLSKTYNMAGWRVAFAVGNPDVVRAINLFQDHVYVSLFSAVQLAAATALTASQACVDELVARYESRRNVFISTLAEHGLDCPAPGGSFFVWMPAPKGIRSAAYAEYLIERAGVAVAPGIGFGDHGDGYVRVGLLTSEDRLCEAAYRIAQATAALPRA